MKTYFTKRISPALALLLALSTVACAEAGFRLAPESRLPRWLHVPGHLSRSQLTVELETYSSPWGPDARFRLWDDRGNMLDSINVRRGKELMTRPGVTGMGLIEYPIYELITVRGIPELIEFRQMEPIFYVSDDAAIKASFGVR
jgi:hypothetical protein